MDKAEVVKFFESRLHPIDRNGNIKFEEKENTYRYKFKDRVFSLHVKDKDLGMWVRLDSTYYSDIEGVVDGRLKLRSATK